MNASATSGGPCISAVTAVALFLVLSCGTFIYLLYTQNEDTSQIRWGLVISLLFFNNLNIFIAACEIALGNHIMLIKEDYKKMKEQYAPKREEVKAVFAFLFMPVPLNRLFDGRIWSRMWSTYALYDPSYQSQESFGFFIDVGNGWSTIPPSLLMNVAMAMPKLCNPLFVGCVCLASYWQVQYGTIIYFLSFIWNKRYQGKGLGEVLGFVGVANGIWFVFPLAGIYACVSILNSKDFSIFGH